MDVLNNFDTHLDFWEVNPQLKVPFKKLYSNKDIDSSSVMWSIALYIDPDSKFKNAADSMRKGLIEEDFFPDMDWEKYKDFIELYKKLVLSKKKQFLVEWEQKLEERSNFIASKPYDEENYEMLDKMMKDTEKMWSQYLKCLKDVEEEEQAHTHGNIPESIDEQGII